MPTSHDKDHLVMKLKAIQALAEESAALLKATEPDVGKLLETLKAQSRLQQALMGKLLEAVQPTAKEMDLNDTFHQAVGELLEYFRERTRLAGKVADAAAIKHLRKE